MIRDKAMIDLVDAQIDAFNRDAPADEKIALLERIQKRQRELAKSE
jgi:hypothetical protein